MDGIQGLLAPDTIGMIVGAILTLMIFSYVFGDNVLYRWALALLVGSSVGYALGVGLRFLYFEWIQNLLSDSDTTLRIFYWVPFFMGALLILKGFGPARFLGKLAVLGNLSIGYLIGVGAAAAIAGALMGTVLPQISATGGALTFEALPWGVIQGVIVIVGSVASLLVFSPRPHTEAGEARPLALWLHRFGRFFIVVALAAAFAGAITSGLTLWVERFSQLLDVVKRFVEGF